MGKVSDNNWAVCWVGTGTTLDFLLVGTFTALNTAVSLYLILHCSKLKTLRLALLSSSGENTCSVGCHREG
jgi:hypothetical protein